MVVLIPKNFLVFYLKLEMRNPLKFLLEIYLLAIQYY